MNLKVIQLPSLVALARSFKGRSALSLMSKALNATETEIEQACRHDPDAAEAFKYVEAILRATEQLPEWASDETVAFMAMDIVHQDIDRAWRMVAGLFRSPNG